MNGDAVDARRAAWRIIASVEQKERRMPAQILLSSPSSAKMYSFASSACCSLALVTLIDEDLILSTSTGEPKVFYYKTETIEEQASKLDGSSAAQAREWKELRGLSDEELVTIRDTNKLLNDSDELIPRWLNVVQGVVDSEDLLLNVCRENLLQNKILREIKKNHVTKYLDMLAEIAELNDDYKKFYEQFVKCMKLGIHENSVDDAETAELLMFNTSKPGDEQFSYEERVDRMKEGKNDIYRVFRWLGPFPTHDQDLWIRTSGEKVLFLAFGLGPRAKIVGKSQGKCKNKALGKMANFGPFSGPRMAISCQKRRPCFDNFPVISCVFSYFLTSQHHTTHTPYHTHFSLFLVVFSVFPHAHSTQHTHSQTHMHTHIHTCH